MSQLKPVAMQIASNRTPRHINSNIVLNLIRRNQPISRADLARTSTLRPSTISLIIEDLIAGGWVLEGEAARSSRGRRPVQLTLNHQRCVIALDIHPSQTTVAVTDISGHIIAQELVSLPRQPGPAVTAMIRVIRRLIEIHSDRTFAGIGICLPGRTELGAGNLIFAPNLGWPTVSLKSKIERATNLRVEMDNVANACGLSEVWFGDSDGSQDLVIVEVSEGIGTGIFVNGSLVRGCRGMAGEFGHIEMVEDGPLCNCGSNGCWETLASNPAAIRHYQQTVGNNRSISFSTLLRLERTGDKAAAAALRHVAEYLGRGMRTIIAALDPAEIIVVGEITAAWQTVGPIVDARMRQGSLGVTTRLRPTYDGGSARLRSAVALVLGAASL